MMTMTFKDTYIYMYTINVKFTYYHRDRRQAFDCELWRGDRSIKEQSASRKKSRYRLMLCHDMWAIDTVPTSGLVDRLASKRKRIEIEAKTRGEFLSRRKKLSKLDVEWLIHNSKRKGRQVHRYGTPLQKRFSFFFFYFFLRVCRCIDVMSWGNVRNIEWRRQREAYYGNRQWGWWPGWKAPGDATERSCSK